MREIDTVIQLVTSHRTGVSCWEQRTQNDGEGGRWIFNDQNNETATVEVASSTGNSPFLVNVPGSAETRTAQTPEATAKLVLRNLGDG